MAELIGQVLDDAYRVEQLIGQGGMGAVYAAHDLALDRQVAIKVMHPHIAREQGFRERFLQEARAVAALDHPGIVQVHAFSRDPERLYIVMSLIEGGRNLADWLKHLSDKGLLMSLVEALLLVETLCDALAYAHARGVTHRDIKPGNILLRPVRPDQMAGGLAFRPVLTDFGLAKLAQSSAHTLPGQTMGTPAYMAPEQCMAAPVDGRTDLYSLGIVFYELLTGRVPFGVRSLPEALEAHTRQQPPAPRLLAPDLPSEVEQIVLKTLAKQPAERYQTAEALAEALEAARRRLAQRPVADAQTPSAYVSLATFGPAIAAQPAGAVSRDAWPTPPSDAPASIRLIILRPDGSTEARGLPEQATIAIGREEDNDLVLTGALTSRHHARLSIENGRARITDLSSTNGTFLQGRRILPGVAERWTPPQRVQIGDYWLSLELGAAAGMAPGGMAPPGAAYGPTRGAAPAASGPAVEVSISPETLALRPGEQATLRAHVLNRQPHVDHFCVRVEGVPEAWVTLPGEDLYLAPGDGAPLELAFAPSATPPARSGPFPFVVHVMSRADVTRHAEARGRLTVEPSRQVEMALHPSTLVGRGSTALTVWNRGNGTETLLLAASDPAGAVTAHFASERLTVEPGQSETITVEIGPSPRAPDDLYMTCPFQLTASVGGEPIASVQGALTLRPHAKPVEPPRAEPKPSPQPTQEPAPKPQPAPTPRPQPRPQPQPEPPARKKAGCWRTGFLLTTALLCIGVLLLGMFQPGAPFWVWLLGTLGLIAVRISAKGRLLWTVLFWVLVAATIALAWMGVLS